MQRKKREYDEEDPICFECIEDHSLREIVKSEGTPKPCCLCGKNNISVTINELAEIIDPHIREHFAPGAYERKYGSGDDDGYWEEQRGEDLSYVVQEIIGQSLDCEATLVDALIDSDPADPRDGGEPFYERDANYEATPVYLGDLYEEWRSISDELRSHRRFFSDRAREFFDWLFEELEHLWFYERQSEIDLAASGAKEELKRLGVVQEWPPGTSVFRARRADTLDDCTHILRAPLIELAPPPTLHARAGRMNPEGVTIFYGALDEATCLAEMRSSIGAYAIVGCFKTTKSLQVLDFGRLDQAYWAGKDLSYFQSDFERQIARRKFLRRLHRVISQPIVPGHEGDYLITQVLAEYLAHVRKRNFDGLLFASTQRKEGTNVVLFNKNHDDEMLTRFALEYVEDSATLHRTRQIEYDMEELDFFLVNDEVHILQGYEDDE